MDKNNKGPKITLCYDNGSEEQLEPADVVNVRYLSGVDCTEIPSGASGGEGWDKSAADLLAELMTEATPARQRNWWQIRNEDDGQWTVIDHVATRQRAERGNS
jgi:hypothetical protein